MAKKKPSFKLWPVPKDPDIPYGPTPKQALLFIDDPVLCPDPKPGMSEEDLKYCRPHYHPLDVVLFIGAARSGKTISACARVIKFCIDNPGAVAIVGAVTLGFLQRTVIKEYEERFTINEPWDHLKLPNSLITRRPVYNRLELHFTNGSRIYFLHLAEESKLKGINASIVSFEEADQLPSAAAFEELLARLANNVTDLRQMILTTNPVKARKGWINKKFRLYQLDPRYRGKKEPIVPPCACNYCPKCKNKGLGNWIFEDPETKQASLVKGAVCSNPDCANIKITSNRVTGFAGMRLKKDNNCPGGQVFYRIIETSSDDNPHKASDYEQSSGAGMSRKTREAMIEGSVAQDHEGEVYLAFDGDNVNFDEVELDYDRDIHWCMDQDEDPHCSLIVQETETEDFIRVDVIDEIFVWDTLAEEGAKEFCRRYHSFKETGNYVNLWSDPAGLYGNSKKKDTFYQKIIKYLTAPTNENGDIDELNGTPFKIKVRMKKDPRPYSDKDRQRLMVFTAEKVQAINDMLKKPNGERRVFINMHCEHLILSLESVKWVPGKNELDKSIDKKAKQDQENINPTTHPSDALGYYLAKRFPLIKAKQGVAAVANTSGKDVAIYKGGKVYTKSKEELSQEVKDYNMKLKAERDKQREALRKKAASKLPRNAAQFMKAAGFKYHNMFGH